MSKAEYISQIRQLVELQKIDDEIFETQERAGQAPRILEDLESRFKGVEDRRSHVLDKLDHLREQKKRISLEIEDDAARIKKSRNKLMQVGNDREYQAMLREMESMEKSNRTREEEKLTLLEELSLQEGTLEEIDGEYNAIKKELEEKRAGLDATLAEAARQLARLEKDRALASQDIPQPVFQRYEFIRKRLEHPVIVDVDESICSGCHIAIPPQTFIELQTGQQIHSCPNCQRLIYWRNDFEDPATIASKQRKPKLSEEMEEEGLDDEAQENISENITEDAQGNALEDAQKDIQEDLEEDN